MMRGDNPANPTIERTKPYDNRHHRRRVDARGWGRRSVRRQRPIVGLGFVEDWGPYALNLDAWHPGTCSERLGAELCHPNTVFTALWYATGFELEEANEIRVIFSSIFK